MWSYSIRFIILICLALSWILILSSKKLALPFGYVASENAVIKPLTFLSKLLVNIFDWLSHSWLLRVFVRIARRCHGGNSSYRTR